MNKFQVLYRLGILVAIGSVLLAAADSSSVDFLFYPFFIGLIMIVVGWIFK